MVSNTPCPHLAILSLEQPLAVCPIPGRLDLGVTAPCWVPSEKGLCSEHSNGRQSLAGVQLPGKGKCRDESRCAFAAGVKARFLWEWYACKHLPSGWGHAISSSKQREQGTQIKVCARQTLKSGERQGDGLPGQWVYPRALCSSSLSLIHTETDFSSNNLREHSFSWKVTALRKANTSISQKASN